VDFLSGARPVLPPAASGVGHLHLLRRRLTMIMRGTTPRALTASGVLAVLAAGALLLPLLPTFAQDTSPRARTAGGGGVRAPEDAVATTQAQLEKRLAELHMMERELQKVRADLEARSRELERNLLQIKVDEATLRRLTTQDPRAGRVEAPRSVPAATVPSRAGSYPKVPGTPGLPGVTTSTVERRLDLLEKKLDVLLHEVVSLRQELGQRRPTGPGGGGGSGAAGGRAGGFGRGTSATPAKPMDPLGRRPGSPGSGGNPSPTPGEPGRRAAPDRPTTPRPPGSPAAPIAPRTTPPAGGAPSAAPAVAPVPPEPPAGPVSSFPGTPPERSQ
jgi:hypothetical protein